MTKKPKPVLPQIDFSRLTIDELRELKNVTMSSLKLKFEDLLCPKYRCTNCPAFKAQCMATTVCYCHCSGDISYHKICRQVKAEIARREREGKRK